MYSRPTGNIQGIKRYFHGQHYSNRLKADVSLYPDGIAIDCSPLFSESISDISNFPDRLKSHPLKFKSFQTIENDGLDLADSHWIDFKNWASLMDKEYFCLQSKFEQLFLVGNQSTDNYQFVEETATIFSF